MAPKSSSKGKPRDKPSHDALKSPLLGVSTTLPSDEIAIVQEISRQTRWFRIEASVTTLISAIGTLLFSITMIGILSVFYGISLPTWISAFVGESSNLSMIFFYLLLCISWLIVSLKGLGMAYYISSWIQDATYNLINASKESVSESNTEILGSIGAVGCLRRVFNIINKNRVYLVILEGSLGIAVLYYILVFAVGSVLVNFSLALLQLPTIIQGTIEGILIIGTIGIPILGILTVYASNRERVNWFRRIDGRDFLVEDIVTATPIEIWMLWRVQPGIWEIIGEILEYCQFSAQSLGRIIARCQLSLTDVTGFISLLKVQGWISEFLPESGAPSYNITDQGRGFLQLLLGAWQNGFKKGTIPRSWTNL